MAESMNWNWMHEGVDLYDDHLLWYEDLGPVAFASGAGSEQTFADFLANGPVSPTISPEHLAELTAAVRARL